MLAKVFEVGKLLDIVRAHYDKVHVVTPFLTFKFSRFYSHAHRGLGCLQQSRRPQHVKVKFSHTCYRALGPELRFSCPGSPPVGRLEEVNHATNFTAVPVL